MRRFALALGTLLGMAPGCDGAGDPGPLSGPRPSSQPEVAPPPPAPAPAPWSDPWLLAEADRYLHDRPFRRRILEASLSHADNQYARARLSAYALPQGGWDALPVWIPRTAPVTDATVATLRRGGSVDLPEAARELEAAPPTTLPQWVELGRRVFERYPLRPEVFAEHALAHPEVAAAVGLRRAADGRWPGVVAFEDLDGEVRIGITCALCHVEVTTEGTVVPGRARRDLDYGQMRLAFHRDTGAPLPAELARRMATWGPGRADITQDDAEDPVAIPDLWGLADQSALTQAGTIRHVHPAALAIRQETQILHANRERTRPPRTLAWALAMYVYALAPPPAPATAADPAAERGRALFETHCRDCHHNRAQGGDPIPARRVGVDSTLAFGPARGTGMYRPSPLVRVADAAPYLHQGTVPSLDALLSDARLQPDYRDGARGAGPIRGHTYGIDLPLDDRRALVAYLRTL